MNFLLQKKYTYTVASSFHETKAKLDRILNNKWYNQSAKYYGTITGDTTFSFRQKIFFGSPLNFGQTVYLTGVLVKEDQDTIINIKLSPNLVLVFLMYLFLLFLLNVFSGDNSLMGEANSRLSNFFSVLILELSMFAFIQVASYFLQRSFEKAMIEKSSQQRMRD